MNFDDLYLAMDFFSWICVSSTLEPQKLKCKYSCTKPYTIFTLINFQRSICAPDFTLVKPWAHVFVECWKMGNAFMSSTIFKDYCAKSKIFSATFLRTKFYKRLTNRTTWYLEHYYYIWNWFFTLLTSTAPLNWVDFISIPFVFWHYYPNI